MNTKIQPVRPAGISDEAAERLAAETLAFYHRFMQRPDAREILEALPGAEHPVRGCLPRRERKPRRRSGGQSRTRCPPTEQTGGSTRTAQKASGRDGRCAE